MDSFAAIVARPYPMPDAPPVDPPPGEMGGPSLFGDDGLTFLDVLDIINPLQHIPVVSTIYRAVTGDEIAAGPRVIGGALFGGLIGAVSSLINAIVDEISGKDIGEHIISFVHDVFDPDPPTQQTRRQAAAGDATGAEGLRLIADVAPLPADYVAGRYDHATELNRQRSPLQLDIFG